MASSVWASHKTFAGLQYTKIKNMLAFQSDPEAPGSKKSESIGLHLQKLLQQTRPQKQEHDPETDSGMPAESSSFKPTPDRRPARDGSSNIAKLLPSTPTIPDLGDDSLSIVDAFKKTFAKTWKPAYAPPERGTVIFSGMVEIVGPKGFVVLDVRAAYHPVESRWTQMELSLRRAQLRKQGPRGGP